MAEVHFDPSIEISISDSAFYYAWRLECSGTNHACDCECHFRGGENITCNCKNKGRWKE